MCHYKLVQYNIILSTALYRLRENLTHWGRDKMAALSQTTRSNAFSWMKMLEFRLFSLKFVHKGSINNIPALVQIMAGRRPGDKPLSEPMVARLPTHICVTRPQWVNQRLNSQQTPPYLTLTGELWGAFCEDLVEIDHIITALHCTMWVNK